MKNKKLIILFLTFAFVLLVSSSSYSITFTDALTQVNSFFEEEQYKPYANTIDFFFFALLFISVYLIGVRYAFKEVNKPEKVIAVLLGLMSSFLLVKNDVSIILLLPYLKWFLYLLMFIAFSLLFRGMKSKFWRFVLALFLTLLIIALAEGLFEGLSDAGLT